MILQALTEHYETLAAQGKVDVLGWGKAKISYALCIRDDGELERVMFLKQIPANGKKDPVPQLISLPAAVKRTVGIMPNFLWDNSSYLLGVDDKGKPQRSVKCFEACRELHREILGDVDSPAARAVLAFFERWEPSKAQEHPALAEYWADLTASANLVFRWQDSYVHEDPQVRQAWQVHYGSDGDGPEMACLVTGRKGPAEPVHPAIKGVVGAQSSGAALVSFNAPAFCSYGHEQNLNAPVGKYAAFAYTTALNALLADREHVNRIGETTVLFWAKSGRSACQNLFAGALFGAKTPYSVGDLAGMVEKLCKGEAVTFDETRLDPNGTFYVLGLAPNAARLSVRFFLRDSFGNFLSNLQNHQKRLEIVRPSYDQFEQIPIWSLLSETVNQNSRDKSPSEILTGEMLYAVLTDTRYPATLLNGVVLRIRAEHKITRGRAAILKAYYLKNPHPDVPKEVLQVSLNPDCHDPAYVLGRLFSVLEAIQSAANPDINATIVDKYLNSASATPSRIFPMLMNLARKHLRKLETGKKVFYDKQLTALLGLLENSYPDRLSLPQQGSFQLGYYHQTQARYQKKEEKKDV